MPFKKGEVTNPKGRPRGTPNRTTQEAKELLETIMYGQLDNITDALSNIKEKSDRDYIDACVKMFQYVLPKKTDVTSDNEKLESAVHITVDSSKTADELKKLIDGSALD